MFTFRTAGLVAFFRKMFYNGYNVRSTKENGS